MRDADALHYDSTISRFVFPFHGEKKGGEEEIPHLAANRHKTASLRNESLGFTRRIYENDINVLY